MATHSGALHTKPGRPGFGSRTQAPPQAVSPTSRCGNFDQDQDFFIPKSPCPGAYHQRRMRGIGVIFTCFQKHEHARDHARRNVTCGCALVPNKFTDALRMISVIKNVSTYMQHRCFYQGILQPSSKLGVGFLYEISTSYVMPGRVPGIQGRFNHAVMAGRNAPSRLCPSKGTSHQKANDANQACW